jgi:Family of unknown function (DUF5990)
VRRDADGFDFSGPYVRGDRADRNLFLAWGDVPGDGTLRLIRGSKLGLAGVDPRLVEEAMRPGHRLVARIRLTGTRGEPALTWSAAPARPERIGGPRDAPRAHGCSLVVLRSGRAGEQGAEVQAAALDGGLLVQDLRVQAAVAG